MTLSRGILVGHGRPAFEAAAEHLLTWGAHRDAGLRVTAEADRVTPGTTVSLVIGRPPLAVTARCVVLAVVEEPRERGFVYEALPGHPERGVQHFRVSLADDGTVSAVVHAESAPASLLARLGGPVTALVQRRVVDGYLRALRRAGLAAEDRVCPVGPG
ncbi:DUF1990 family protein [Aquipuribacter sp. SD81]|uniref:DUF1990 family protein n=1 Tax=Aquipuribacter sp. SD81 TaxID=3127703 RepID=UPI00301704CD